MKSFKVVISLFMLVAVLSGCQHPLVDASDNMTATVFPYCKVQMKTLEDMKNNLCPQCREKMIEKGLINERFEDRVGKRNKMVLNAMTMYEQAVIEAKGE